MNMDPNDTAPDASDAQAWVEWAKKNMPTPKPHEPVGAKHDAGKPRAHLMIEDFADALMEVSKVTTFGANKYAPRSWLTVPNAEERYADALMRHILAKASGEDVDPESGLPHAAHIAWNALALMQLEILIDGIQEVRK